eukprot:Lithocolla_globosa_v1_NODE_615_length_3599_cov_28.429740.p1 type:complete len:721 gc:universal NODE_615_length_3599_cov_28.429740:1362-3524(+)
MELGEDDEEGCFRFPCPDDLSEDELDAFDWLLFLMEDNMTEKSYERLLKTRVFRKVRVLMTELPSVRKTLFRRAWKLFSRFVKVECLKIVDGHKVPWVSTLSLDSLMMQHEEVSRCIVECSQQHTLPYLNRLDNEIARRLTETPTTVEGSFDGVDWLAALSRCERSWRPFYDSCQSSDIPVVFGHNAWFEDGFAPYLHRKKSKHLLGYTSFCVPHAARSHRDSPANHTVTVVDDVALDTLKLDFFLEKLVAEAQIAIKGRLVWCEYLKRRVGFIRVLFRLLADLPAYCENCGLKQETNLTERCCGYCWQHTSVREKEFVGNASPAQLRNEGQVKRMVEMFQTLKGHPLEQEQFGQKVGLQRVSPIYRLPGVVIHLHRYWEILHAEYLGEVPKHLFAFWDEDFLLAFPHFFHDLNKILKTFSRVNPGITAFPSLDSIKHFKYAFTGVQKGSLFINILSFYRALGLTPARCPRLARRLNILKQHVEFLRCATRHKLVEGDIDVLADGACNNDLRRNMILEHGPRMYTINTHQSKHIDIALKYGGLLREGSTFVWEGTCGQAKETEKKNTGSRSVSYSCTSQPLLLKLLRMLLRPHSEYLPPRYGPAGEATDSFLDGNEIKKYRQFYVNWVKISGAGTQDGERMCTEDIYGQVMFFFTVPADPENESYARLLRYEIADELAEYSDALVLQESNEVITVLVSDLIGSFFVLPHPLGLEVTLINR